MPKLRDKFEKDLYQALTQCGFSVDIAFDSLEVDTAELEVSDNRVIRFIGEDEQKAGEVKFLAGIGNPADPDGGSGFRSVEFVLSKQSSAAQLVVKIKEILHELDPQHRAPVPETVQEVPGMDKRDLEKRRDNLLDRLNTLPEGDPKKQQIMQQLRDLRAQLSMMSSHPISSELDKFMIGKELGKFSAQEDGTKPCINIWVDAIQEKADLVSKLGFPLTNFQTALFTFLHEMEHHRQLQAGEVTAAETNDSKFKESEKCQALEKQADEAAVNFIKAHRIPFHPHSLNILANEAPPIFRVGEVISLNKPVEVISTVYFSDHFFSGHTDRDAADVGQYRISIPEGTQAVINAISGAHVNIIELSHLGKISAFDSIKGRELANEVKVCSCDVDLEVIRKVA